ncbi:hypothetical protein [Aeromonas hydrophila]|uniref:hypothetical protein n=1 Tax=Aeromonas hydrophila TaxID=644 RepID=UPI001F60EF15|nr:hypothetical protein [Aeromonas hydrophila]UNU27982.1 hypothetical protein GCK65_01870 [Aeromonas hydrophila]
MKWFYLFKKSYFVDIALVFPSVLTAFLYLSTINYSNSNAFNENDEAVVIIRTFISRPALWILNVPGDHYRTLGGAKTNWFINERKVEGQSGNILNITLDSWLGFKDLTVKGCVDDVERDAVGLTLHHCTINNLSTGVVNSSDTPPEATLFTYALSKNTLNAGYYYYSHAMKKEVNSYFYWLAKYNNGQMLILKKCPHRESCTLTLDDALDGLDIGVMVQPIDEDGTFGRGDANWFHYSKGEALQQRNL